MRKGYFVGVVGAAAVALFLARGSDAPPPDVAQVALQGYFKSQEGDRVQAYISPRPLAEAEARAVFEGVPHTSGRVSRAVIYVTPSQGPSDGLTLAPDLQAALQIVSMPPHDSWEWRLQINPRGEASINQR